MLDCHSRTWPGGEGNRDNRSRALNGGQIRVREYIHFRILAAGYPQEAHSCFWTCRERRPIPTTISIPVQSLIRSIQFAFRRNRFPRSIRRDKSHFSVPDGFSSPCVWRGLDRISVKGLDCERGFMVAVCFWWKREELTASSAESVRLVVTLTKAGGTLRYTQEQQSASLRKHHQQSRVSLYPIFFPLYLAQHLSKNGEPGRSLGSRERRAGTVKRTHLGGRWWLGVKLGMTIHELLIWGRATPFSRWSVELPALIFAWEWRGPGTRLNHVMIPSRMCT